MDDFRKIIYGVLVGFLLMIIVWISFLTYSGCGFSLSCAKAVPTVERTSIPTLWPATLPALNRQLGPATASSASLVTTATGGTAAPAEVAKPSNPGGPGQAISLNGDAKSGQQIFVTNCQTCHGTEAKGGNPNPGSTDGTIPALNPIDSTIPSSDAKAYATNIDLFVEHGSIPAGANPTFSMPVWGDKNLLNPQQIADVIAYVISLNPAPSAKPTASSGGTPSVKEPEPTEEVAKPSNPGGVGQAAALTGDPKSGQQVFTTNCQICHGTDGKGGNPNPGSSDGTIPSLNPIDSTLVNADSKTFAANLDLFLEHGSTPEGTNPTFSMPAWGDKSLLAPQQIADVISYVMSLNPAPPSAAAGSPVAGGTPATSASSTSPSSTSVSGTPSANEPEPTEEVARPSNPGGPGVAITLKGDPTAGQQIFTTFCQLCHNTNGTGGNPNPGSSDGTVPALNPIDPTLKNTDYKTFATNLDLFIEHGSTPEGTNPTFSMPAWGDKTNLTPQQIADVIAYIISLNK